MPIGAVCVFCASSERIPTAYREAAARMGSLLAAQRVRLVYGGGRIGLMGVVADAALAGGGEVIGVIPRFLVDLEVAHRGLTELRIVDSMHERKRTMAELADGFVALPGGFGTLEETIEVITWRQLGLHEKPIVLVSPDGFWDPLARLVDRFVEQGFAQPAQRETFATVPRVDDVLAALEANATRTARADVKWT